ncbi:hypothetical protein ABW19_dt0206878 [Dactylella cylindrospora]|nr:hypothetical protein ABW19_dt0206878 [Dactylella cylindrospora]
MLPFFWKGSTAFSVLINTIIICLSLPAHSLPSLYNPRRQPTASTFKVRTTGPNYAGIITHPPATVQQVIFGGEKRDPRHLPLSGLWTRGGLKESTYSALDSFLHSNDKLPSYYYTLTILGLGLHDHPDGLWKFFVKVDLAVNTEKDARGHTKLPQLTITYKQPHPGEANAYIFGDILEIYELSEKDILETMDSDEPAVGVMEFISSRVSRMGGFSHKHVGIEEFELDVPRTTANSHLDDTDY